MSEKTWKYLMTPVPWWKFWDPRSGSLGGFICGAIVGMIVRLFVHAGGVR